MSLTTIVAAVAISLSMSAGVAVTPRISGIAPPSLKPGPTAQQVTVTGEGFMRGLTLVITNPTGSSQVYKDIEVQSQEGASFQVAAMLPVSGVYLFVVTNPDGGVSQPFRLELRDASIAPVAGQLPPPRVSSITPSRVSKRSQPLELKIDGSQFAQGLTVILNDPVGGSTTVSGRSITNFTQNGFTFTVELSVEGEYTVTVVNPDGKASNPVSLSVQGAFVE